MRALNVHTFQLENLNSAGDDPPVYAILSHRWERDIRDEVLFEDLRNATDSDTSRLRKKRGFAKVVGACKQAARDGFDHIWIDSCCINQDSSAELSESINSMYRFYQEAQVCYAFLAGLSADADLDTDLGFENHEWFTRGWTLQELLAPMNMKFFTNEQVGQQATSNWIYLGEKAAICDRLSAITKIDSTILSHKQQIAQASVASRMSWAATRVTTKPEDRAYSLMGLFDVNMPMIYGEGGTKAFLRLQEEIIKVSSDQSIFAWRSPKASSDACTGVLATSPEMFKDSGSFFGYCDWEGEETFTKTNRGLQITLPLRLCKPDTFVAALNCSRPGGSDGFAGIYLRAMQKAKVYHGGNRSGPYERVYSDELVSIKGPEDRGAIATVLINASGSRAFAPALYPDHVLQLRKGPDAQVGWTLYGTMGLDPSGAPSLRFNDTAWIPRGLRGAFQLPKEKWCLAAVVVFTRPDQTKITILLGTDDHVGGVSAQIIDGYDEKDFGAWKKRFRSHGHSNENPHILSRELVFVDVEWQVIHSHKYYVVDIGAILNPEYAVYERGDSGETQESADMASQVADEPQRSSTSRLGRFFKRPNDVTKR